MPASPVQSPVWGHLLSCASWGAVNKMPSGGWVQIGLMNAVISTPWFFQRQAFK